MLIVTLILFSLSVFPETPGTASTANNMCRCILSAVAVAIMQPLIDVMGKGWFFTLLGILTGGIGLLFDLGLRRWGMQCRNSRRKDSTHG